MYAREFRDIADAYTAAGFAPIQWAAKNLIAFFQ